MFILTKFKKMFLNRYQFVIICAVLICTVNQAFSQRVGLVLSGGGAPGIAHIGVIKALEENEIPIDYITGTSIGGFVGGLYASGMSPDEMIRFFKSSTFKKWKRIKITFPKKTIFPTHINNPLRIQKDVEALTQQATLHSGSNFDSLFVPFRCVASDVYKKKPYVFNRGNLATAIRASMSYPFLFEATQVDDRLLFDGGIYNNFPTDIMLHSFRPDIMIGSVVAYNPPKAEINDMLMQLQNMIVHETYYNIPDSLGLVINFDLKKTGVLDFSDIDGLVKTGYEETLKQIDTLKQKIHRRTTLAELQQKRMMFRTNCCPANQ